MIIADWLSIWIWQLINKHSAVTSTMAGVNCKMNHKPIEDSDILVIEAYASCWEYNIIPRSGLLSDNELCSSCVTKQRCINCNRYLRLHLYADGEIKCHACVKKWTQFGSGLEKSNYKSLWDTVEEHLVTSGEDQSNVKDFFENSEDEIKSTLDVALKMHV